MNFLEIDEKDLNKDKKVNNENKLPQTKEEIIELKEEDNVYIQKSEIVVLGYDFLTNEEIKEEIIIEQIPISRNMAKKNITRLRI
ncbi:hypothetical protein [Campylobacter sp. MIT 97-5078]|nr:hypothetical protein [Campylobacter sp. MIT 97-5078]